VLQEQMQEVGTGQGAHLNLATAAVPVTEADLAVAVRGCRGRSRPSRLPRDSGAGSDDARGSAGFDLSDKMPLTAPKLMNTW
jgi:hypothetical protein